METIEEGEILPTNQSQPIKPLDPVETTTEKVTIFTKIQQMDNKHKFFYVVAIVAMFLIFWAILNSMFPKSEKTVNNDELTPTVSPTPDESPTTEPTEALEEKITPTAIPTVAPTASPTPTSGPTITPTPSYQNRKTFEGTSCSDTTTFAYPSAGKITYSVSKIKVQIDRDSNPFYPEQTVTGDGEIIVSQTGNYSFKLTAIDGTDCKFKFIQYY